METFNPAMETTHTTPWNYGMRHHGVNNSKEVAHMTKYREILRLASLGLS
jgi:hypothetical protein